MDAEKPPEPSANGFAFFRRNERRSLRADARDFALCSSAYKIFLDSLI
jgi:hypothetical protein